MRQGQGAELIEHNHQIVGICLGADFCAEHEWGIKGIERAFGIERHKLGVKARTTRQVPKSLRWIVTGKRVGFLAHEYSDRSAEIFRDHANRANDDLYCAWCGDSFIVVVSRDNEQFTQATHDVYHALADRNAVFWLGGGGVFKNAGLCIGILERLPKECIAHWKAIDLAHREAESYKKKSGIEDKLRKAGKEWFALSPQKGSDGTFRFWLNPWHQQENNFGWFTLKELELWAEDKGPIPIRK